MTTLTVDGNDASQEGDLTEEEHDSLEVGEQMEAEQEQLLAGKYKNADELEKAHIELQRKLGEQSSEEEYEESEEVEEEVEEEYEEGEVDVLDRLWQDKDGEFTDETLTELAGKRPGELAKMYLQYRQQAEEQKVLTEEDVTQLKGLVGGEEGYQKVMAFANESLSDDEHAMFNYVIDTGDKISAYFAVQNLFSRYKDAVGTEGDLITGKPPSTSSNVFRSQAEMVEAMNDPRYNDDPAYRRDIENKLSRSNIEF